jgi:hypothetical protein
MVREIKKGSSKRREKRRIGESIEQSSRLSEETPGDESSNHIEREKGKDRNRILLPRGSAKNSGDHLRKRIGHGGN